MATKTIKIGLSDSDKASMQAAITALVKASLITVYSSSATYALGDFVYYDGKFYKCTTAISTAEAWTNGHWTEATLNDVINKVNQAANSVENKLSKGDYDATTGVGYSDVANNLIATKGLTVNDDPMSYGIVGGAQKSAVGDGNASLNKLVCVDVVRNQYARPLNSNYWSVEDSTRCSVSFDSGEATVILLQGGGGYANGIHNEALLSGKGHIWLMAFEAKSSSGINIGYDCMNTTGNLGATTTNYKWFFGILTSSNSGYFYICPRSGDVTPSANDTFSVRNVKLIDLTQCYGNNDVVNAIIGATASEQVDRLLAFDPEILNHLEQNTGTLVPSKTAKLLPVGVNQWDEVFVVGALNDDGTLDTSATGRMTSTFVRVVGGSEYYIRTPLRQAGTCIAYNDDKEFLAKISGFYSNEPFTVPLGASFIRFSPSYLYGVVYNNDICINVSDPNINGKYYPSKRNPVTLPNYEGHGILKVVNGKVVADGTELYPDGNSKKRWGIVDLGTLNWTYVSNEQCFYSSSVSNIKQRTNYYSLGLLMCSKYTSRKSTASSNWGLEDKEIGQGYNNDFIYIKDTSYSDAAAFKSAMSGVYLVHELKNEEDITTPVFQSTFPVEQGGTLQFLDENDNPIAGLQGSEIFYQKNIKAFVEALGEATDWDPERIKRLGNLSFTPEYEIITLNPSFPGAYARAQVYNATFTIVISAALTGTANGSITFQDSEVDLSNLQTKPAESIIDMDGKKVSEAPTTADCNIASFVGRSKSGTVMWSLLHSGVNKVKIHIEEAVPLDSDGNGKIDCRASLIL